MRLIVFCMLLGLLASCDSSSLAKMEFQDGCWKVSKRLEASIEHPGGALDLPVSLVLDAEYPFSNLYLQANLKQENGLDTTWLLSHTFVDPLGNWLVESSGKNYEVQHPVCLKPAFPKGNYTLTLGHYMRPERVCGVKSIAILAPSKSNP